MTPSTAMTIVESRHATVLAIIACWMGAVLMGGISLLGAATAAPVLVIVAALAAAGLLMLGWRFIRRINRPWTITIGPDALVVSKGDERRAYDWSRMSKTQVFSSGRTGVVVFVYDDYGRYLSGNWAMEAGGLWQIVEDARLRYRNDPPHSAQTPLI